MAWIKRHLFFVVGGVLTLVFLGGAGFFIFQNYSRNSEATDKLNEIYGKLKDLSSTQPQPGNEKINNTEIAKEQEKQLLDWTAVAAKYFVPIPSIPRGSNVSSAAYAEALRQTIDTLQHEADNSSVTVPPKYDFSFSAQRSLIRFSGSLDPLAEQLGEVKAISEILFAARVNDLDSIQRVRVSDDDVSGGTAGGSQADYIEERPVTNDLAIITPYVVTFRTFTPELARVISGFASSSNLFIVKAISAMPASSSPDMMVGGYPGQPMPQPGGYQQEGGPRPGMPPTYPGGYPPPGYPQPGQQPGQPPVATAASKGGLQTILKEQLLRITLEVEIVKLRPKS